MNCQNCNKELWVIWNEKHDLKVCLNCLKIPKVHLIFFSSSKKSFKESVLTDEELRAFQLREQKWKARLETERQEHLEFIKSITERVN